VALVAGSLVGAPGSAAGASLVLNRWQGADRYGTAAALAEAAYPGGAQSVVVASGESFPDALSASYLAGYLHAPVLLAQASSLPPETSAALAKLGSRKVYVVGGPAAVGDGVLAGIRRLAGVTQVVREAGPDRYATSLAVASVPPASAVGRIGGTATALVASGASFPDALAGSALAAGVGLPILLTAPSALSPQVTTALHRLGIGQVLILGGPVAVSPAVQTALNQAGVATRRLAGSDRGATAAAIAGFAVRSAGFPASGVAVARGDNAGGGVDALALSALAGVRREPLLLTESPTQAGAATLGYLSGTGGLLTGGDVAGGPSAVSEAVLRQLIAAAESAAPAPGSLQVQITDLPNGVAGDVTVTGPNGLTRHVTATSTLNGLAPGTYQISATPVRDPAATTYVATQTSQTVTIAPGASQTATVDYFTQIPATTKMVDPAAITAVGTGTATVTGGPTLDNGDIIAVGTGPNTPDGLLVKVDSVSTGGPGVQNLTTEAAALTDAMPQGDFSATADLPTESPDELGPAPGQAATATATGATSRAGSPVRPALVGPGDLSKNLLCGASASLGLYGQLDAKISPAIHARWSLLHGPSVTATITASETASFSVNGDAGASCTLDVPISALATLPRIAFSIGPIPVVIVPKLQFFLHATAAVNDSFTASIDQEFSATAGLAVSGSSVTPIGSVSNKVTYDPPIATGTASGTVFAGPELTLALYGLTGPKINVDAGLDLESDTTKNPWWTLDGELKAGASLQIPELHINASDDHVITLTRRLAQADGYAIQPWYINGAQPGVPFSQQLTATGGTAPYTFAVTAGALLPGLTLSPSGVLSGTPGSTPGDATFTVTATDAHGVRASQQYTQSSGVCGGLATRTDASPRGC
jgi:putative cell wall-binding protein